MKRDVLLGMILCSGVLVLAGCGQEPAQVEETVAPVEEPKRLDRAVDAAKDASDQVGEAVSATTDAAADGAAAVVAQANEMIEQVKDFLAADKQEMARDLMDKLLALKDSLPEEVRAEIERLEAMFTGE